MNDVIGSNLYDFGIVQSSNIYVTFYYLVVEVTTPEISSPILEYHVL